MGKFIVKLAEDEYVEWSTVVDSPITYAMTREEAVEEYGEARVERSDGPAGSSALERGWTREDLLAENHAGPDEAHVSLAEIRRRYRRWRPWHHLTRRRA